MGPQSAEKEKKIPSPLYARRSGVIIRRGQLYLIGVNDHDMNLEDMPVVLHAFSMCFKDYYTFVRHPVDRETTNMADITRAYYKSASHGCHRNWPRSGLDDGGRKKIWNIYIYIINSQPVKCHSTAAGR